MEDHTGRFSGDMDRNEVEMDLNKFMAMIEEISQLKDKIRELEDATNVNPWQKVYTPSKSSRFLENIS
jgi:hypothetical protein